MASDDPVAEHFCASVDAINAPAPFSDDALASRWVMEHGKDWRYVSTWSQWFSWSGSHWERDETQRIVNSLLKITREIVNIGDGEQLTAAQQQKIGSAKTIASMDRLAGAMPECASTVGQWDTDPWLLATPDGVVDLSTGESRPAVKEDYLSQCTSVSPGGDCPLWLSHLETVTGGDVDLQHYLQRIAGYTLSGLTQEHAFFYLWGPTSTNGKSTFIDTLAAVMGSYAKYANIDMLLTSKQDRPSHEIADLTAVRGLFFDEVKEHRSFDSARLKSLTSAKVLSACRKYEAPFEFQPCLKMMISANSILEISGAVDQAFARRCNIIPFRHTIPIIDIYFADRLKAEHPGILAWMIRGCLNWQRDGLAPPAIVREATATYLREEDSVAAWLEERCVMGAEEWCWMKDCYDSYKQYSESVSDRPMRLKRLLTDLKRHGIEEFSQSGLRALRGVGMRLG